MLNSKQRAYLKSLMQTENAIFQVGKGGVTENLITQLKDALEKNEVIKISLLDTILDNVDGKRELAEEIAKATRSEIVSIIGKKVILYKKSQKKPKLELPR